MKIKTRILAILGIMAGGYLLLLAMVQISATASHRRMLNISTSLFPAALKMQEAESAFERMKKHYGDAVVLQDSKSLDGAARDAEATGAALDAVKTAVSSTPELVPQANGLLARFSSIRARDQETYAAILGAKDGPSDDLMAKVGALGKDNKALTEDMGQFDRAISSDFQKQLDVVDAWAVRSRITGLGMLIFIVVIGAVAWWVIQSKVVRPLASLALRLQDIAEGEGDLTRRIDVQGDNEIDTVGTWFNVFIERIEVIIARVAHDAQLLGRAARELAEASQATATQAAQQQEQALRIKTTMNEISSAVHEISETTQKAALDASKSEEAAHGGGRTVETTLGAIQRMQTSNQQTSAKIEELGRSNDAIGKIISVIDDIANQTNLLALNASIEAARAGEQGRGFAVVAGEVRRLAERTSAATNEIDSTVRGIQRGTGEAVEAMRVSMAEVNTGVDSARSAGDALVSIIAGAESLQKMVSQIAAASTEQSYSTHSVNENVSEIVGIIDKTATNSVRAVEACQQLYTLASDLSQMVGAFKVRATVSDS